MVTNEDHDSQHRKPASEVVSTETTAKEADDGNAYGSQLVPKATKTGEDDDKDD